MYYFNIIIKFKRLDPAAIIPTAAYPGDSGMDFYTLSDTRIAFGEVTVVGLGLAMEIENIEKHIPAPYYYLPCELQMRPKSGLAAKHGITIVNSPGTIDIGYRGELRAIMTRVIPGEYIIKKGCKIMQGVICPIYIPEILEVEVLSESDRGEKGLGSSG